MASAWGESWSDFWGNSWGLRERPAGGWYPNIGKKPKRNAKKEWIRLGLVKENIEKTAKKVVFSQKKPIEAIDNKVNDVYHRPDVADLVLLLMQELRVTVYIPDYTIAIEAALRIKQEQEDEEAILLLM